MSRKLIDIRDKMPRHPTRRWKVRKKADTIVVHTNASNNQDPFKTARYHITPGPQNHISKKGAPGLCYHDFITQDGKVFHCNDYTSWTWHAGIYNKRSIGIVMAFKGQDGLEPAAAQYLALEQHLVILCLYLKILPNHVIGHREVPGMYTIIGKGSRKYKKTCPGMAVDLDDLRDRVTRRLQRRLAAEGLYRGEVDGLFGTGSMRALQSFFPPQAAGRDIDWKIYGV